MKAAGAEAELATQLIPVSVWLFLASIVLVRGQGQLELHPKARWAGHVAVVVLQIEPRGTTKDVMPPYTTR